MKKRYCSSTGTTGLLKIFYKSAVFVILVAGYLLAALFINIFTGNKAAKLGRLSQVASFFSTLAIRTLKVNVRVADRRNLGNTRPALIVSNHLSYLDIFITSSVLPSVFIAGMDGVQENFLIGSVTKLSGSIFVERKTRAGLSRDIRKISEIIPHNINLVLYPEGMTTDGRTVQPFKSSLFLPAAEAGLDVLAMCFKYRKINGEVIDESNKDRIFFYGEMSFFSHFFSMMTLDSIDVDLHIIDLIRSSEYSDRKEIRDIAYRKILDCYESE